MAEAERAPFAESRPVPDPTELTNRAMAALTVEFDAKLMGLRELIETRLDAMDKAIVLLQHSADKTPATMKNEVQHLRELTEEKFEGIATQFREIASRTEQTGRDSKLAIDAALQAQKEAAGKSEANTTKQIDSIGTLLQTAIAGLNDKIDDTKARLGLIEGHSKGSGDFAGWIVGIGGLIVAMIAVALVFLKQ